MVIVQKKKKDNPSAFTPDQAIDVTASISNIDATLEGFVGTFGRDKSKKYKEAKEQYKQTLKQMDKGPKEDSKEKETKTKWQKTVGFLFKGIQGLFKGIASIAKSLIGNATGIIGLLLGLFLMLKLGLLDTLLPAAFELLKTLVSGIIKFLPSILKFVFNVLVTWIPKLVMAISDAISDVIGLGPNSPLRSFISFLVGATLAFGILGKILNFFGTGLIPLVTKAFRFLMIAFGAAETGATTLSMVMTALLGPIGLIILAVVAIAAALVLLWKYAKPISNFFDNLWERFKNLSTPLKILVGAIALITLPLTAFVLLIVGLVKLFKSIQEIGFLNTLKLIGKAIPDWLITPLIDLWKFIKDIGKNIWNSIKEIFSSFYDLSVTILDLLQPIFSLFKGSDKNASNFLSTLKTIWNYILPALEFLGKLLINSIIIPTKMFFSMISLMLKVSSFGLKLIVTFLQSISKIGFAKTMKNIWKSLSTPFIKLGKFLSNIWDDVITKIKNFLSPLISLLDMFKKGKDFLGDFFTPIMSKIKKVFMSIGDIVGNMLDTIVYYIGSKLPKWASEKMDIHIGNAKNSSEYLVQKQIERVRADPATTRLMDTYAKSTNSVRENMRKNMSDSEIALAESLDRTTNAFEKAAQAASTSQGLTAQTKRMEDASNSRTAMASATS